MPRTRFSPFRPLLYTVLLLCAWWVLPSAVKLFMRNALYECQAPAWVGLARLADLPAWMSEAARSRSSLLEENRDMARLNSAYMLRLQQAGMDAEELARVGAMLKMPPLQDWNYVVGRVIRRDLDTWWQRMTVQLGAEDGVRKGDGVVCRDGVVGRVMEVHAYTCVVELLSSASFRVAAHVDGDMRPVTYVGTPAPLFRDPGGEATNLPADMIADPARPLRLVTSRLGGVFPDGLTIGYMRHLEAEPDGLFQRSKVLLNPSLTRLREVAVLVPVLRAQVEAAEASISKK